MANEVFKPVVTRVLGIYSGPDAAKDPQYKAFYDEVVTRCVADVAGMLQSSPDKDKYGQTGRSRIGTGAGVETPFDSSPGSELHAIYQRLKREKGQEGAQKLILGNLPAFTKGIVYTPHPTELLSDNAIEAQENLLVVLKNTPELFAQRGNNPTDEKKKTLETALEGLGKALSKPLSEPLTIDKEMRRSVRFSQRQFDAIPGIADTIMAATDVPSSSDLDLKQLHKFAHLIGPETWSPGDQDSKPDMTAEKLEKGANLSRRAMMFHYYRTLTALAANIPKGAPKEAQDKIQLMMYKLLKAGCEAYDDPHEATVKVARDKLLGVSEGNANGHSAFSERFSSYVDKPFFHEFEKNFDAIKAKDDAVAYKNSGEFLADLEKLREMARIQDVKDPKRKSISVIDSLIIQTMNFKDAALRIQVRQNAEVHKEVLDTMLNMLPESKIPAGVNRAQLHSETGSSSIETLLAAFKKDTGFRRAVQEKVKEVIAEVTPQLGSIPKEDPKYKMYQAMETLGLAAQHPDRIPRYLIAECRSKTDMLEAFFLLKVMESIEAPNARGKVEIVNLVEHPDLVKGKGADDIIAARMTAGAMENEQFREHHLSIKTSNHLLEGYSLKDGEHRLTVAEAKRANGIPVKEGDEAREIKGVKMMMGAGSDVTKAGSAAAASAMADAIDKTREALLNMKEPVLLIDYIGCGGGVHRTQPVSTSYETVQGQSMRQLPENIEQKTIGLLTDHLRRSFAMNPERASTHPQDYLTRYIGDGSRDALVRVNMGNLAGLPQNDALWNAETRERTYAMMEKYGQLYKSKELEALMSYSADMYANMTKFAARPGARVGAATKLTGFLAPVDVKETRAIGYGAALNAAGINAPLFFGGSEYLKSRGEKDDAALRDMYLYDPKAQDSINRMTYGIIMADMGVAWKYQGRDKAPDNEELNTIAKRALPEGADKKALAEKGLAEINLEYNEVARRLLRLQQLTHSFPVNEQLPEEGKQAADRLLATLPPALREQLTLSREHIKEPREALANLFKDMLDGKIDPKSLDKKSDKYNKALYDKIVYPAMGAIFECTEHVPRAYSRPKWAAEMVTRQQQRVA